MDEQVKANANIGDLQLPDYWEMWPKAVQDRHDRVMAILREPLPPYSGERGHVADQYATLDVGKEALFKVITSFLPLTFEDDIHAMSEFRLAVAEVDLQHGYHMFGGKYPDNAKPRAMREMTMKEVEQMLQQVWTFPAGVDPDGHEHPATPIAMDTSPQGIFFVDESYLGDVAEAAAEQKWPEAQVRAAFAYWRRRKIRNVNVIAERYTQQALKAAAEVKVELTPEQMLRQKQKFNADQWALKKAQMFQEESEIIDSGTIAGLSDYALEQHWTYEQFCAVLDCWRAKMLENIDTEVQLQKSAAEHVLGLPW